MHLREKKFAKSTGKEIKKDKKKKKGKSSKKHFRNASSSSSDLEETKFRGIDPQVPKMREEKAAAKPSTRG